MVASANVASLGRLAGIYSVMLLAAQYVYDGVSKIVRTGTHYMV